MQRRKEMHAVVTSTRDLIGARFSERFNPARLGMKLWYAKTMLRKSRIPTPNDAPLYRSAGPAWRVLLIGNGATHGWGVTSHADSLTGQLGEQLERRSGWAVNLDYVGDELMNAQCAVDWLAGVNLADYDAIIVLLGWNDAVRLTPERIWQESVRELMGELRARKRAEAGLVVVGIEPMSSAAGYYGVPGKVGQAHADKLNAVLRAETCGPQEAYTALSTRKTQLGHLHETLVTYRLWAKEIAKVAAKLLPPGEPQSQVELSKTPVFNWVGARAMLGYGSEGIPAALRKIEAEAKRAFKVNVAQVTLLDGQRQWFPTHAGVAPTSAPRHITYCDVTAQQAGMLVVPNGKRDARFKGNPYLEQMHMPFYAGHALVSRSGEVIGTFCVLDLVPRPSALINRKKFMRFVERAQEELWRIENVAVARAAAAAEPQSVRLARMLAEADEDIKKSNGATR